MFELESMCLFRRPSYGDPAASVLRLTTSVTTACLLPLPTHLLPSRWRDRLIHTQPTLFRTQQRTSHKWWVMSTLSASGKLRRAAVPCVGDHPGWQSETLAIIHVKWQRTSLKSTKLLLFVLDYFSFMVILVNWSYSGWECVLVGAPVLEVPRATT